MSTLEVHEHPDGSYTVKDAIGHVVHTDLPGPIDFNGHGSVTVDHEDESVDVTSCDLDPAWDELVYRLRGNRGHKARFGGMRRRRRRAK